MLQVTTYTREVVTGYPGNMYRDTGLAVTDAGTSDGVPLAGSPVAKDDIFNHTAPKQETKERFAHYFIFFGVVFYVIKRLLGKQSN